MKIKKKTRKTLGWIVLGIAVILWLSPLDLPGPVEEIIASVIAYYLLREH